MSDLAGAGARLLERNRAGYGALLAPLATAGRLAPETALVYVSCAATFAEHHHPGCFADGALENVALDVGARLGTLARGRPGASGDTLSRSSGRRHVLHVATGLHGVGGHSRTIGNWIRGDPESRHSVVVIAQGPERLPVWIVDAARQAGGGVTALDPAAPLVARAAWLRETADRVADLVVVHHAPFDVVPTVAFAVAGGPPVAVLNHADHVFWLGSGVADTVINHRRLGQILSETRRFAARTTVLPIPLTGRPPAPAAAARAALGIAPDVTVLVTVGRAVKYRPTPTHDFWATMARLLDRHPGACLYVAGASPSDVAGYAAGPLHPRIHLLGSLDDVSDHVAAADVFLESFPFGSQTALLEAALAGVATVRAYAPALPVLVAEDEALDGLADPAGSEGEYLDLVDGLIRDGRRRRELGARLRESVARDHTGPGWRRRLADVYAHARALEHRPRPLPRAPLEATAGDVALATWQAFTDGSATDGARLTGQARRLVFDVAYLAREAGDHAGAFRLLRDSGRLWGWERQTVMAAAKLLPHRLWRAPRARRRRAEAV